MYGCVRRDNVHINNTTSLIEEFIRTVLKTYLARHTFYDAFTHHFVAAQATYEIYAMNNIHAQTYIYVCSTNLYIMCQRKGIRFMCANSVLFRGALIVRTFYPSSIFTIWDALL